jgi:hypothetical protein
MSNRSGNAMSSVTAIEAAIKSQTGVKDIFTLRNPDASSRLPIHQSFLGAD